DGQELGGALSNDAGAQARLVTVRRLTALAFAGTTTGDAAFDALGLVARETGLTPAMAEDVIAGFALDVADWQPRNETDLMRYCWHVAGAVGVMMAVVMGVSPQDEDTLDRACDLGLAFQLANIARDLREDDAAARCYVPAEWLVEEDIPPGEQMKPPHRAALARVAARMQDLAQAHEASARIGAARLAFRQRWAVLAAAGIYGEIGREVVRRGTAAWDRRVAIDKQHKALWIVRAGLRCLRPVRAGCHAAAALRRHTRSSLRG
ncbi:MAG: hypothetical protein RIS94_3506, partial [Pseudomonadota bacterium]